MGSIVTSKLGRDIMVDPQKVEFVKNWATLTNVMEINSFMGWVVITTGL